MRAMLSIAGKELRALFQSQVAVLFLALFLVANDLTLFVVSRFFARNLADLTPMFQWLPVLLIVLVSAVAMRAWAEEERAGTLEVLLTLPVRTADLVLGKFLAGMALVAIALATTLPIPFTVMMLGPLDWGPVIGGYVGALLLASTYLSIGLCISARTDNQVVALMGTVAVGGLLYLVGSESFVSLLGSSNGEIARLIGTGSRFDSIARGVVDLRDVLYYASLTTFFLVLNSYFLDRRRIDPVGGSRRLAALLTMVVLVGANALAANFWLHPVRLVRVDLTENQDYTISSVTEGILRDLDEPLLIQGIFSERSHPKLQPLAPRVAALLEEYAILGPKVRTEILDPSEDDDLADLLLQEFGVRPVPMPAADRNETRIVNSWFHVLLRYGNKHAMVPFTDLLEVDTSGDQLTVRLRDPEYDITKAIKRVTQDFASAESLVHQLPEGSRLVLYASPESLDEMMASNLEVMRDVSNELAGLSDRLSFEEANPLKDPGLMQRIEAEYAVVPAVSFANGQTYYLHLVLVTDENVQRIFPRAKLSPNELRKTLESAFQRTVPGQLKTVAVVTERPKAPPTLPGKPQQPPPPPDFRYLRQLLAQRFELDNTVDLTEGAVPDTVDVLILGKVGNLTAKEQVAIDQFLLRGGSVIVMAGHNRVAMERGRFSPEPTSQVLLDMLSHYGARVGDGFVTDQQAGALALPIRGRVFQFDYPFWPDLRPDQMNEDHLAMRGLTQLSMPWASRVDLGAVPDGVTGEVLLHSSRDGSGLPNDAALMPDFQTYRQTGFPRPTELGEKPLAVALTGRFPSFFTDETRPEIEGALTEPVAEGRLVVLGSSEMLSDVILEYASSSMGRMHANNPVLLQNLIDWAVADTDLLSIRNPGRFSRALAPLDEGTAQNLEYANYAFGGLVLAGFFLIARRRRPIPQPRRSA